MFCCKQLSGIKMVFKMCQTFRRPIIESYLGPKLLSQYNMKLLSQNHCNNTLIIRRNHNLLRYSKEPSYLDCFMTDHAEDHIDENKQTLDCGDKKKPKKSKKSKKSKKNVKKNGGEAYKKPLTEVKKKESKTRTDAEGGVSVRIKTPFKLYRLTEGPAEEVNLSKEKAKLFYTQMQIIRRIETVSDALYKEKIIRGFCHLYSGQEACAVGIKAAMRDQDNVITAYRCHGWSYLMNISPPGILAELMGRKTGVMRGKGGSMHMYAPHFFGGNGIVGAQVPLGAGISLTNKYKGDGGVTFACYGDGAANQGQVFEAFNMAYLWKLPCIFVCENNNYGMGTSAERSSMNADYYTRGDVIPGIWVDGMNVLAVRSAAQFAIDYVIKNGPLVMETHTYRYSGHSMSDPGTSYRSREEIQEVRQKRDPIMNFRKLCVENELLTEEETKATDEKILKEIDDIVAKAKTDSEISLDELTADIYSNNLEPKIRSQKGFTLQHLQINKSANR